MTPISRDDTEHGTLYVTHEDALQAVVDAVAAQHKTFQNLLLVIQWLENGCDPQEAAKDLRVYQQMMSGTTLPISGTPRYAVGAPLDWRG